MDEPDTPGEPRRPPLGGGPLWLHPDDDLAPNRPGETLLGRAEAGGARGRPARLLARLLGRGAAEAAWRGRLAAERRFGAALDACAPLGWRTLHSIPLPGQDQVSHLAIGPGGVFAFRTVHCPGGRLRVDGDTVRGPRLPGGSRGEPEVRLCRRAAQRAAHALSRGRGEPVPVRAVLALVGAARVERSRAPDDVRLLRERDLGAFAALGGVLKPETVDAVYHTARDRRTWRDL